MPNKDATDALRHEHIGDGCEWLRFFNDQRDPQPELLGGKGNSLARMTQMGLRVPPGFTIYTSAWKEVIQNFGQVTDDIWKETISALKHLEQMTGKKYGSSESNKLLVVSLRSGAKASMPGLMDSLLNVGINDQNLKTYENEVGVWCARDSYLRLIRMFGVAVYGIDHKLFHSVEYQYRNLNDLSPDDKLDEKQLSTLIDLFKNTIIETETPIKPKGIGIEQDPAKQLKIGIEAIFKSYDNPGAVEYRKMQGIPHDQGTAVTVQLMVPGNTGDESGTLVAFSRDRLTGEPGLSGNFRVNAQGEDVVYGTTVTKSVNELPDHVKAEITENIVKLEKEYGWPVDVEITWVGNDVYFLQTRPAKMTPLASVRAAIDLHKEGIILTQDAILRKITATQIKNLTQPKFNEEAEEKVRTEGRHLFKGLPVRTGIGQGKVYFNPEEAKKALRTGEKVILICNHFNPNDMELINGVRTDTGEINRLQAIVTRFGSPSSHMGLVMSVANPPMPGVMGTSKIQEIDALLGKMKVDERFIQQGDMIAVNSETGEVYLGEIALDEKPRLPKEIENFIRAWHEKFGFNNYWANFLYPDSNLEQSDEELDRHYRDLYNEIQERWKSGKAREADLIARVFPELVFPTTIVPAIGLEEEQKKIRELRKRARDSKKQYSLYPRTAMGDLMLSPYLGIDLGQISDEEFERWLCEDIEPDNNRESIFRMGSYLYWKHWRDKQTHQHDLEAVICTLDPYDKLNPNITQEHFTFTLQVDSAGLNIDIVDHNIHLRGFELTDKESMIRISVSPHQDEKGWIGQIKPIYGEKHFEPSSVSSLYRSVIANEADPRIHSIRKKIETILNSSLTAKITESEFIFGLKTLIENGLLNEDELKLFINERSLAVSKYVMDTVLNNWWNEYSLPHRFFALQKASQVTTLEFQGRLNPSAQWIGMYGSKGVEESAATQTQ